MEIKYLSDVPEITPIIAYWSHKQWWKNGKRPFSETMEVFIHRQNRNKLPLTIVAIDDYLPVGMVSIVMDDYLDGWGEFSPWVAALYVDEEFRNLGIAKKLLEEIFRILHSFGNQVVYLHTETACSYYLKQGWQVIKENVSGPLGKATVMKKILIIE